MFNNFASGLVYGFLAAGILGLVLGQIKDARGQMKQQHRTFDTFSASEQPKLTSSKVVAESQSGTIGCIFWTLVLIGMIYFLVAVAIDLQNFNV